MAKNKKQTGNQTPVYNQILVQPLVRSINDIGNWRTAVRLFDSGNRGKLYDLYEDVMIDGVLTDAVDKRIDAVKDADLAFTIKNRDVDILYDLIDTSEFEDLIAEIMLAKFWGISLDEFYFSPDGLWGFESIPRKHILPLAREVKKREQDDKGISYANDPNIIQWGKDNDLGLLFKIAPLVIYKRGGFGDWSQFVELFGMPLRIGKYSSMDEASRRELIRAFETAGSAPYLVIPKETEATQMVNHGSGNSSLYNDFRLACMEEILITVLGQTMTTTDGSSLAQGQVHLAVQEKKHRADRRYVERMLNRFFVPLLAQRGYPVADGKFKFLDAKRELEVNEFVQLSEILPIPQSYLHEKYNIPLPQGDEPIARRQIEMQYDVEEKKEVDEKIENADAGWMERIRDFFVPARLDRASEIRTLSDDTLDGRLIRQVTDADGRAYFNPELFAFTAEQLITAVRKGYANNRIGLADMSFVYGASDDAYLTAMEQNVFHFSASKTLAEMNALNRLFRESKGFEDFYKKAVETTSVFNKKWMETEFHTAVGVAESASTYRRLIDKVNIFPFWEYKTAGDSKVREEHRKLDGVILPADDARWQKIMPPNGWNCRCYIVARLRSQAKGVDTEAMRAKVDEYLTTAEWKRCDAQGFGINRAVEADVFTANQMYISKFPDHSAHILEKITPEQWGAKSLSSKLREATEEIKPYEGTAADWFNSNKTVTPEGLDVLEVKDYNGRTLTMSKKDFDTHTTNLVKQREARTGLLNIIRDIAANPDEIWLGRERKDAINKIKAVNNIKMVKFYRGQAVAVVGKVENNQFKLKTWYPVRSKDVRRGLLIKK
jgi:SPP1 gp7 family putative phage head morphogenesis protein